MNSPSAELATFACGLRYADIPMPVIRKTEDLLVDWFGSAVAGHGARQVQSITGFALTMGPTTGPSEVIVNRAMSSPYLAAMANAAASHMAEQDDVHNGSVFHPATVVFPAALAVAQAIGASGAQFSYAEKTYGAPTKYGGLLAAMTLTEKRQTQWARGQEQVLSRERVKECVSGRHTEREAAQHSIR